MKAIIIDDELKAREVLKKLLVKYCSEIEIIGEGDCIESAIEAIKMHQPDLVFLDIHLDSQNSFDQVILNGIHRIEGKMRIHLRT